MPRTNMLSVILSEAAAARSAAAAESKDPYPHHKTQPRSLRSGHSCPLPLLLLLVLLLTLTLPTQAQDDARPIALKGGKLLTITHGTIDNGVIVLQAGKIVAVGPSASVNIPANAQIVDATGMTIYPGLIDSET